ncbi:MAG TPA: hypothetical protein VKT81_05265 [Bryobacteraceae bacterium]|nr:hypothetical protein [Bryobacteraceae bacterium]
MISTLRKLPAWAFVLTVPLGAQVNVLTYQYDNSRAGANLKETVLTPANVNQSQFGKLFSYAVDGFIYGQPLYIGNIAVAGKGTHNVVLVATENDSVYAFDADSGAGANSTPLWHVSFLNPGAGVTSVPYGDTGCDQITPELGITSTPVIDASSGTVYVVAMTKEIGGGSVNYVHRLHALDIASGKERPSSPVVIQATYSGTGEGGSSLTFAPRNYKQRPGLLLLNGVVYAGFSSHCDIGAYHGWLMGYDARTLKQLSVYNNTPNGNMGSFWDGGAGPAADANGNIYLAAGNGTFDYASGGGDLGESYIKLSTSGNLKETDYFAPFNYSELNDGDVDVGSAGVVLAGDEAGSAAHRHLLVGAGKEGRIYVLDRDNLGKWHSGSDSQIVASLAGAIGGLFGNPAYFNKAVYFCGSGDQLKAFSLANATLGTSPSSQTNDGFGYPGGVPSISANGTTNGIAWMLESSAVLHAFDASNLSRELYNSNQNSSRDALGSYVKYSVPMIANGKVYAGTQKSLVVYGLLRGSAMAVANAASGQAGITAPGSIISIYGSGLAQSTMSASGIPLPSSLAGASVTIGGISAPIFYASPVQINAQVPYQVPIGTTTVSVKSASSTITVQSVAPGLFVTAQGQAAALNQDGSANGPANGAAAGSVLSLFLTGLGAVDHPVATGTAASASPLSHVTGKVSATLGGESAAVSFAGLAPGFVGLYQVNVRVPQTGAGNQPVIVSVNGVASNSAGIYTR